MSVLLHGIPVSQHANLLPPLRTKVVMIHPLLTEWKKKQLHHCKAAEPARFTKTPKEEQGSWISWCTVMGKTSKLICESTNSFLHLETSTSYPTDSKAIKAVLLQSHLLPQHCAVSDTRWLFFLPVSIETLPGMTQRTVVWPGWTAAEESISDHKVLPKVKEGHGSQLWVSSVHRQSRSSH